MEYLRDFFIFIFVGIIFLFLQQSGIISFLGIRANLLLVFFAFLAATRHRIGEYFLLLFLLFIFFLFFASFWISEISFFCIVAGVVFFVRGRLPGRFFFDFLVLFVGGTAALFFGMPVWKEFLVHGFDFSVLSFPSYRIFVIEILLNFFVAMVCILLGTRRFLSHLFQGA
jgi:hypothetical protein